MKYKEGDKVRIKSLDWYNECKDEFGDIECGDAIMNIKKSQFCGKIVTISSISDVMDTYKIKEDNGQHIWTDEMIEGLVEEEEIKPIFKVGDKITNGKDKLLILNIVSDKYIVEDNLGECGTLYFNTQDYWKLVEEENKKEDVAWMYDGKLVAERFSDGVVISQPKYNKLSINTEFCDDKVELVISPDFELKQEDDRWSAIKKKKEYPKTYEECCKVMGVNHTNDLDICEHCDYKTEITYYEDNLLEKIEALYRLIICRDAYWKIAGEEMGLGKPWNPEFDDLSTNVECFTYSSGVFAFPTPEMRDAFKENFDPDIEFCKELL